MPCASRQVVFECDHLLGVQESALPHPRVLATMFTLLFGSLLVALARLTIECQLLSTKDFKCAPECPKGYYGVKSDEWDDGLGDLFQKGDLQVWKFCA